MWIGQSASEGAPGPLCLVRWSTVQKAVRMAWWAGLMAGVGSCSLVLGVAWVIAK